jgi:hypothetical protein
MSTAKNGGGNEHQALELAAVVAAQILIIGAAVALAVP